MIQFKSILKSELSDFDVLREQTKSKSSYDHDIRYLRNFDQYLCLIDCTGKNITEGQITGWIKQLIGKSSTIGNQVIVIRIFLKYIKTYGLNPYIPPIPKVRDDYVPYIFSNDELIKIFSYVDNLPNIRSKKYIFINEEMPVLLRMMYGCGLRIGETLSIKMKDIDFSTGTLKLQHTKGDKVRIVPMDTSLSEILKQYTLAMGLYSSAEKYLFPSTNPDIALTVASARHRFDAILKACDISLPGRKMHERGPCLHCLRHVFAFESFAKAEGLGNRIDNLVPYLSIYLGHDSLRETEKYLKFSSEMFPEALDRFEDYTINIFPEVSYEE